MKYVNIQCQTCGAKLDIEEGRDFCFCSYCGNKVLLDNGKREETYRIINEAKIKEWEYKSAKEENKRIQEEERKKSVFKTKIVLLVIWFILVVTLWIASNVTKDVAGFSPYQLLLIPLTVFGIVIIVKEIKKFFNRN